MTMESASAVVVIIDYEFGNVRSVANALEAVGAQVRISREPDDWARADALVLPGVGAFGDGMANLRRLNLVAQLETWVRERQKPLLGICVGMQLLAQKSLEGGEHAGLGWVDAEVVRFELSEFGLKVPHVGWNDVSPQKEGAQLAHGALWGVASGEGMVPLPTARSYYFVHSYYLQCRDAAVIAGTCQYGIEFPAMIRQGHIWGVQFHPEKSQKAGLQLLRDFLAMAGRGAAC